MKILVACEESQEVCKAFRDKGHEAYSCDVIDCGGAMPEYHIKADVLPLLNGNCKFQTMDGRTHFVEGEWDMIIAFPPCTYLTVTGNSWFDIAKYGDRAKQRYKERYKSIVFFMHFALARCERIAIENPIGIISTAYKKPTQIIQPYHFGDPARKATCLWLKGLPKLEPTNIVEPIVIKYKNGNGTDNPWHMDTMRLPPSERAKERSKTFPGVAKAMADQWGGVNLKENDNNIKQIAVWDIENF